MTATDHMGTTCTRFALYAHKNVALERSNPQRLEVKAAFYSIAEWLDKSYKTGYFTAMFKIGCPDATFEAKWNSEEVTAVRDRHVDELSLLSGCLGDSLKSGDYLPVVSSLIRCLGEDPNDKNSLSAVEESLVNAVFSSLADDLDKLRIDSHKSDDLAGSVNWVALLGGLTLLCYREYEKRVA
jgi:hypothetical protein